MAPDENEVGALVFVFAPIALIGVVPSDMTERGVPHGSSRTHRAQAVTSPPIRDSTK